MKKNLLRTTMCLFALLLGFGAAVWAQPSGSTWNLKFSDEFNGTSLDLNKWSYGFGWGAYSSSFAETTRPENVTVSNGTLKIKIECDNGYKSGAINTRNKFYQKYGYWEARIKLPKATAGLDPAFWAKWNNEQWPPELDILEVFGADQKAQFTVHWGSSSSTHQQSGGSYDGGDLSTAFHTFGCEWDPNYVKWYVDGTVRRTYARPAADALLNQFNSVSDGIYMMLNIHAGKADMLWMGGSPSCGSLPKYMEVDWVRVYQKGTSTGGSTATTYEAENATKAGGVVTASSWSGASNGAYVDYPFSSGSGVYTEWNVSAPSAGTYTLEFRYTNGSGANRPLELKRNGTTINANLAFNATSSWGTWATVTVSGVSLNSGSNTIRLTSLNNVGPDIDYLKVTGPSGARVGYETTQATGGLIIQAYPNPATDQLTVRLRGEKGDYQVKLLDAAGREALVQGVTLPERGEKTVVLPVKDKKQGLYVLQVNGPAGASAVERVMIR